jgi:hypothetical protein
MTSLRTQERATKVFPLSIGLHYNKWDVVWNWMLSNKKPNKKICSMLRRCKWYNGLTHKHNNRIKLESTNVYLLLIGPWHGTAACLTNGEDFVFSAPIFLCRVEFGHLLQWIHSLCILLSPKDFHMMKCLEIKQFLGILLTNICRPHCISIYP